jgi:hypothetical protein
LCASVLAIARRKTALVRALHGRRPWPDLSSWKAAMGPHWRGREGEGEREEAGGIAGALLEHYLGHHGGLLLSVRSLLCAKREEEEEEEREKKIKRKEKKRRKRKNMEIFPNLKNF